MDSEEAPPPPYSAVDPLASAPNHGRTAISSTGVSGESLPLRGGNAPFSAVTSRNSFGSGSPSSSSSAFPPANFESAVEYFAERQPTILDNGREVLQHHMTIFPRSQAKDFPRRPRCWNSRTHEITQQDWDMFLRYLFPPHLGLASASSHLSRQLRAQIQRDRKDRPQETDEQRRSRISAVVTEWNQCFFEPRATRLIFSYILDPGNAPVSTLCPKCYPAATRANNPDSRASSRTQLALGTGRQSSLPNTPPATPQSAPPQTASVVPGTGPGPYPYRQQPYGISPVPYAPYSPPAFYPPAPHVYPARTYPPPQPYDYRQQYQWSWNNRPYPPQQSLSSSKGGPFGWISQLASHAQKYGERITEQAAQYGDQISEQALAHGRWLEEQAGFGRKTDNVYTGYPSQPVDPRYQVYYYNNYGYPYASTNMNPNAPPTPITTTMPLPNNVITANSSNTTPFTNITQTTNPTTNTTNARNKVIEDDIPQQPIPQPTTRPRSSSLDSTTSDASLKSIDSLSTTSELSSSDFATVRAQLLSLGNHHDRQLYDTAVGLRRHLDVIQESRRQSRQSGWGQGQYPAPRQQQQQQRQRNWTERRVIKDEMRATKKAFRDVLKRAREEQREQRRNKRLRRRQQQQRLLEFQREAEAEAARSRSLSQSQSRSQSQSQAQHHTQLQSQAQEVPLEQRLENINLARDKAKRHESQPTVRSSASFPSTARSDASSEASSISSISTPSTASLHEGDGNGQRQYEHGGSSGGSKMGKDAGEGSNEREKQRG